MRLVISTPQGERLPCDLAEGQTTLGGQEADALQVEGMLSACARLFREGDRLMVEPLRPLSVNGVRSPVGLPRLFGPGDRLELPGEFVAQLEAQGPSPAVGGGTVSLLRDFLGDRTQLGRASIPSLTCLTGLDVGRRFPITEELTAIGRGYEVGVRVRERSVSRRHAQLTLRAGVLEIEDLSTPNGVWVNGSRIAGRTALRDGDVLELGNSLLRVSLPAPRALPEERRLAPVEPPKPVAAPEPGPAPAAELPTDPAPPPAAGATGRGRGLWMIALGCVLTLAGAGVTVALVVAR